MPSFADSIFLFVLALLLFGPKRLPMLARELGKWMGEFRRASNEFKMQMEDELRASEQADRQKQIAAMEAAAPVPPPLGEPAEPEHPHMRHSAAEAAPEPSLLAPEPSMLAPEPGLSASTTEAGAPSSSPDAAKVDSHEVPTTSHATADGVRPVPIATSGSLNMMPPETGLPTPRSSRPNALSGLVDAIPEAGATNLGAPSSPAAPAKVGLHEPAAESLAHGD